KAIHYAPAGEGHPTFSAHRWQAKTASAFHTAIAGCRTTSMEVDLSANALAACTFGFDGVKSFANPMLVDGTNKHIDFNIGGSALLATLSEKSYQSPIELAREIATKMTAAAGTAITARFSAL